MFVGSFNFDPRSTRLNTELGFVIDGRAIRPDSEPDDTAWQCFSAWFMSLPPIEPLL